ncbi:hypothetical protein FKW77_006153 [Venturia effusa]|uniref:Uncharacterized protein n=1 Tax=Venturia effusa TaxID=50376 RepID=A0A517LDU7_9PEZI|nr:hypothetical protein FKW77_006153 [Venturia effusa]
MAHYTHCPQPRRPESVPESRALTSTNYRIPDTRPSVSQALAAHFSKRYSANGAAGFGPPDRISLKVPARFFREVHGCKDDEAKIKLYERFARLNLGLTSTESVPSTSSSGSSTSSSGSPAQSPGTSAPISRVWTSLSEGMEHLSTNMSRAPLHWYIAPIAEDFVPASRRMDPPADKQDISYSACEQRMHLPDISINDAPSVPEASALHVDPAAKNQLPGSRDVGPSGIQGEDTSQLLRRLRVRGSDSSGDGGASSSLSSMPPLFTMGGAAPIRNFGGGPRISNWREREATKLAAAQDGKVPTLAADNHTGHSQVFRNLEYRSNTKSMAIALKSVLTNNERVNVLMTSAQTTSGSTDSRNKADRGEDRDAASAMPQRQGRKITEAM